MSIYLQHAPLENVIIKTVRNMSWNLGIVRKSFYEHEMPDQLIFMNDIVRQEINLYMLKFRYNYQHVINVFLLDIAPHTNYVFKLPQKEISLYGVSNMSK